jgi:hypothetical protein
LYFVQYQVGYLTDIIYRDKKVVGVFVRFRAPLILMWGIFFYFMRVKPIRRIYIEKNRKAPWYK